MTLFAKLAGIRPVQALKRIVQRFLPWDIVMYAFYVDAPFYVESDFIF